MRLKKIERNEKKVGALHRDGSFFLENSKNAALIKVSDSHLTYIKGTCLEVNNTQRR